MLAFSQAAVEELERKITEAHRKGLEEEEVTSMQPRGATSGQEAEGGVKEGGEGGSDDPLRDDQQRSSGREEDGSKENKLQEKALTPPPPPASGESYTKTCLRVTSPVPSQPGGREWEVGEARPRALAESLGQLANL